MDQVYGSSEEWKVNCGDEPGWCGTLCVMERICSQCHALLAQQAEADWCPACGGALTARVEIPESSPSTPAEVDHRGIVLPRRHALGGIITPR